MRGNARDGRFGRMWMAGPIVALAAAALTAVSAVVDTADGNSGNDTCVAENRISC